MLTAETNVNAKLDRERNRVVDAVMCSAQESGDAVGELHPMNLKAHEPEAEKDSASSDFEIPVSCFMSFRTCSKVWI